MAAVKGMGSIMRWFAGLGLLLAAGCASAPHEQAATPPSGPGPLLGEVIQVRAGHRYVVLACAVLPSAGEEATVFRGNRAVGRVRVTPPVSGDVVACDLIEGDARKGDKVRRETNSAPQKAGAP